jgi:hypothetical protein
MGREGAGDIRGLSAIAGAGVRDEDITVGGGSEAGGAGWV